MRNNFEKLGETLNKRMQSVAGANSVLFAELGTITSNMGLQVYSIRNVIPRGDYLVSRDLKLGPTGAVLTQTKQGQGNHPHGPSGGHGQYSGSGVHSHPSSEGVHVHDVLIPETMRTLAPGDRVLVIWCGCEPVVTNILETF